MHLAPIRRGDDRAGGFELFHHGHQQEEIRHHSVLLVGIRGHAGRSLSIAPSQPLGGHFACRLPDHRRRDRTQGSDLLVQARVMHGRLAQLPHPAPRQDVHPSSARWVRHDQFHPATLRGTGARARQQRRGEGHRHPTLQEGRGMIGLDQRDMQLGHGSGTGSTPPILHPEHERNVAASRYEPRRGLPAVENRLLLGQERPAGILEILGQAEVAGCAVLGRRDRQVPTQLADRRLVIARR